ncbi:T9SS type A sorting domain-containing protein [Pontimicrobium sp. SW4]|uniref:T9SS type A sorting domain-containing protein n=1 Tax=Pontimicrobium sp. SW4 TaxID=3153519 RepID=A0AAU7BVV5_9FLAO
MKKTTIALLGVFLLITLNSSSQTITTGTFDLSNTTGLEFSVKIDVSSNLVTLTLVGPADRWLGLGFGPQAGTPEYGMVNGNDVVLVTTNGTVLSDRYFGLPGDPPGDDGRGIIPAVDAIQNWTIISNTTETHSNPTEPDVRTLVATRLLDTGEVHDYVFSTSDTSVDLVWARSSGSTFDLGWHFPANRGITMAAFHTLGLNEYKVNTFSISPNPGRDKLNLRLEKLNNAIVTVEVFDVLGKKIYVDKMEKNNKSVNVSQWNNGVYLVRLTTETSTQTKRFVKQ